MTVKMRNTLIGVGVVVLAAALVAASGLLSGSRQAEGRAGMTLPTAVEVEQVRTGGLQDVVSAVGTIGAMHDVIVSSETAGRVTAVLVKVGDMVRPGQALVLVDDELKRIALEQAAAHLQAAETNLSKSQKDFEREQNLHSTGDVASVELEAYRLALRSAEAQYKSALMGLKLAERQLADTRIKAPVAGSVAWRKVDVGEMVAPGTPVANIVDIRDVKVMLSIPEEEIGKIRLGQKGVIRVDSRPLETFTGTVYAIGSKSESSTAHAYAVEVIVRNRADNPLKAGMFARLTVETDRAEAALIVPKSALVEGDVEPSVYVMQDGVSRLRKVRVGITAGEEVQILEGVREGEMVISFGQKGLKDGSPVVATTGTDAGDVAR